MMYIVADVLLVAFLGLLLYRGIKKGLTNSTLSFIFAILTFACGLGAAFAVTYFVLGDEGLALGWLQDMQLMLINFAQSFASILNLANIQLTTADLAYYMAVGFSTLILFIPFYALFRFFNRQWERFVRWVRAKCKFFKYTGSVLGGLVNFALGLVLVLGFYTLFAVVDGSGLFSYTNEVLRSGHITGLIYQYNPLIENEFFDLNLGLEHGQFAETISNILNGYILG